MRILCIGDSNTWGYMPGIGLRDERRWPRLLAQAFPEDEIIEEGLCGRRPRRSTAFTWIQRITEGSRRAWRKKSAESAQKKKILCEKWLTNQNHFSIITYASQVT